MWNWIRIRIIKRPIIWIGIFIIVSFIAFMILSFGNGNGNSNGGNESGSNSNQSNHNNAIRKLQMMAWKMGLLGKAMPLSLLDCSNHGVAIKGKCLCDLGWGGEECSKVMEIRGVPIEEGAILMVVDWFNPMDMEHENAIYYTTLATFMAKSFGLKVHVLQLEAVESQWDRLVTVYANRGVKLMKLERIPGLMFQNNKAMENSYLVYRHILERRPASYQTVYFFSKKGAGYYVLLAQRQGLICLATQFIHALDALTMAKKEKIRKGNSKNALITDIVTLRMEWMMQKSVEYSDAIIASTKSMLDVALDEGWKVPDNVYLIPHLTLPVANEKHEFERADELLPSRQSQIKEFVYVGQLGTIGGLQVFLNSIDNLLSKDLKSHKKLLKDRQLKITFWGPNDIVNEEGDLTGEHYIEMRAYSWGSRVKWSISSLDLNLTKLIRYLLEPGKGRLAISSAIGDSSSFILHQALRAGVPIISSNLRSAMELVHIQDRRDILFSSNDTVALSKKLLDSLNNGVLMARPQASLKQYESQWRQLFSDLSSLKKDPNACPMAQFELDQSGISSSSNPSQSQSSSSTTPMASIIITHYNRAKLLQQAIAGVESQTFSNFEVILVDDGSTDPESIKYLSELGWKWWQEKGWKVLREPNRYLGAARNTGARHARGKYLLFIDDDDVPKAHQLETMLRVAEQTGADIVTTGHDLFHGQTAPRSSSIVDRYIPMGPSLLVGMLENCFGDSSFLVHRQYFLDSGGFTEEYGVGFEDYEFLSRAVVREQQIEVISEPLHWYRQHPNTMSMTTDLKTNQHRFLRAYLEMFPHLSKGAQQLLKWVQNAFFTKQGPSIFRFDCINTTSLTISLTTSTTTTSTTTTTTTTTNATPTTTSTTPITTPTTSTTTSTTTILTTTTTTSTTTTSSTTTSTTTTTTTNGPRTCPCRSIKKTTKTSRTRPIPTCWTTQTITPTFVRVIKEAHLKYKTATSTTTIVLEDGESVLDHDPSLPLDSFDSSFPIKKKSENENGNGNRGENVKAWMRDSEPPTRAPMALSAEYSSIGDKIIILMDRPVNVELDREFDCYHFFQTRIENYPNQALIPGPDNLDPNDKCTVKWTTPVEAWLRIGASFLRKYQRDSIQPGRLLVWREGVVSGLEDTFTIEKLWVEGAIEISSPMNPIIPRIIIDAPVMVSGGKGDMFIIDLSRSTGSGASHWTDAYFDFTSTGSPIGGMGMGTISGSLGAISTESTIIGGGNIQFAYQDHALRQALHQASIEAIKDMKMIFELPISLLSEYTSYTFTFTLWNMFGVMSSVSHTISRIESLIASSIGIDGPNRAKQSEPILFVAKLPNLQFSSSNIHGHGSSSFNNNNNNNGIMTNSTISSFGWQMILAPKPMKLSHYSGRPVLAFERNSLNPGNHILLLRVTLDNGQEYSHTHAFEVVSSNSYSSSSSPLEIEGGSRAIGMLSTISIKLQGYSSQSNDESIEWKCYGSDRESPCQTISGQRVDFPRRPEFTFDASIFPPGMDIRLMATVSSSLSNSPSSLNSPLNSSLEKTAQIALFISPKPIIPIVEIEKRDSMGNWELRANIGNFESIGKPIVIASIDSTVDNENDENKETKSFESVFGKNSFFKWESLEYCDGKYYSQLGGILMGDGPNLVLPKGILQPDAQYCIKSTLKGKRIETETDQNYNQKETETDLGWAFIILNGEKSLPYGGYCELIGPATGWAFESQFNIGCYGWASASEKIFYRFFRRTKHGVMAISPASEKSFISFTLPPGHYNLQVEIYNANDSSNEGMLTMPSEWNEGIGEGRRIVSISRKASARLKKNQTKESLLLDKLTLFEQTRTNIKLGYEILAIAAHNVNTTALISSSIPISNFNSSIPISSLSQSGIVDSIGSIGNGKKSMASTMSSTPISLARLLHLIDILTLNSYLDSRDGGPFFVNYLARILPVKLPIDLRPVLLRILHRLALGMSRDTRPNRCFSHSVIIGILKSLDPIMENPQRGSQASFTLQEIKAVIEQCLLRIELTRDEMGMTSETNIDEKNENDENEKNRKGMKMMKNNKDKNEIKKNGENENENENDCSRQLFTFQTHKLWIEYGLYNPKKATILNVGREERGGSMGTKERIKDGMGMVEFNIPSLEGMTQDQCLGYRASLSLSNLMRNHSIDHQVAELSFRNGTNPSPLTPWFRTKKIKFTLMASMEFRKRLKRGWPIKCVWYKRQNHNATLSNWTDEGCEVISHNNTHVECSCNHLTEFSLMIDRDPRVIKKLKWLKWSIFMMLGLILTVLGITFGSLIYTKKIQIRRGDASGKGGKFGPVTKADYYNSERNQNQNNNNNLFHSISKRMGRRGGERDNFNDEETIGKDDDGGKDKKWGKDDYDIRDDMTGGIESTIAATSPSIIADRINSISNRKESLASTIASSIKSVEEKGEGRGKSSLLKRNIMDQEISPFTSNELDITSSMTIKRKNQEKNKKDN